MRCVRYSGTLALLVLVLQQHMFAQNSSVRIKPAPPPKKTTTADNAPPNPRMFILAIGKDKRIPPAAMQEYTAKEYNGKVPVYDLKKMDPDLFKVFKSPDISILATQSYLLTVDKEADKQPLATVNVKYPAIVMPPPEVDPVQTLAMRNAKNDQGGVGNIQATKVVLPKTKVPEPEQDPDEQAKAELAKRRKKGYKNIVFEKVVNKDLSVASNAPGKINTVQTQTVSSQGGTVNVQQPATTPPPSSALPAGVPVIYDTARVSRRRSMQEEQMVVTSHHDTIYIIPGDYEDYVETKVKPAARPSVLKEGTCGCMQMDMMAADTINFEDYVNYGFTFKNNCKEAVYVHSFSFRFQVYETNGYPAKRLRKIDFVKRFDYPEYVKIRPGGSYEYHFADDPFFEYDLSRGKQYKFTFMYNNYNNKSPQAPQQTHLCNDPRDKVIYVQ